MKIDLRKNNLDWLRLGFAFQVILIHGLENLKLNSTSSISSFVNHFPGVPAFFFVSGFLIYASFDKNPNPSSFFKNRFLRLFPGLVFVTIGGLGVVVYSNLLNGSFDKNVDTYLTWFVAQITLGQAWNPAEFRDVGIGVVNGALWTITVEILFYVSVPLIYWFESKFKHLVIAMFIISFLLYAFGETILKPINLGSKNIFDYLSLTPAVWGWMFLLGTLVYKNLIHVEKYFKYLYVGFPVLISIIYFDLDSSIFFSSGGNSLGLIYFSAFCAIILIFAFHTPFLNLKHDISYGIYIWHMVVINLLIVIGIRSLLVMMLLTILISIVSWLLIERPMLKKKKVSLRASA